MATARIVLALLLCAAVSFGGVINVTSNATLTAANAAVAPGDTVKLSAGTYTVQIAPATSGTYADPIVYMPAVAGTVCSLYVSGSSPVYVVNKNYVIVQDLRIQMAWSTNNYVINVDGSWWGAILNCKIYGGSTHNTSGWGDWPSVRLDSVCYYRVIGNTLDRQDQDITTDGKRGDGIAIYDTDSKYNIVEGNTCYNVSHAAIAVPYGSWTTPSMYNIVRFNTCYNNHIGWGAADQHQYNLFEGNRSYYPGPPLTYRGGVSTEGHGKNGIYRYNESYDDITTHAGSYLLEPGANSPFLTQGSFAEFTNCRMYGNAWLGSNSLTLNRHGVFVQDASEGSDEFGENVWKNNIIASPNPQYSGASLGYGLSCPMYYEHSGGKAAFSDTLDGNLFWDKTPSDTIIAWDYDNWIEYHTLASMQSELPDNWLAGNVNVSPLWVDSVSKGGARSFQTAANSPCIDAGVALTTVASGVSSSTVVTVGDVGYFHFDWGANPYDRGDSVLIGTHRSEIDSIDYGNRRLILKTAITVAAGAEVHVLATYRTATASYVTRYSGDGPDIGPYERITTSTATLPGSTTLVSPADSSSHLQPITFRWRAVSGATKYWLSVSEDEWSTLKYNNASLTDTFATVTGLTEGATASWNVATGNDAGWNTDAWSTWWDVEVGGIGPIGDTLTVNWDSTIVRRNLTASTAIEFTRLQRRDLLLVLYNAAGETVEWPANIRWIGMPDPPQPAIGDTTIYWFVRDGAKVYGFDLTEQAAGAGITGAWVLSKLAAYVRSDSAVTLSYPFTVRDSTFAVDTVRVASSPDLYLRPVSFGFHQYGYPSAKPAQWTDYHAFDVRQYINGNITGGLFGAYCVEGGIHFGGSDTLREGIGVYGLSQLTGSGRMLSAVGVMARVQGQSGATGTINTGYGLFVKSPSLSGGTLAKYHGIYVEDGPSVTDTLLWIGSGRSRLGGDIWVGGDINGTAYMVLDSGAEIARYGGYLLNYGELYLKKDISFVNKAGNAWLPFAHRDDSGAEAKYNLDNIGVLAASGAVTFPSTLTVGSASGYIQNYGDYYARAGIGIINIAGNSWLSFASRNTSGAEAVYDLANVGNVTPGISNSADIGSAVSQFDSAFAKSYWANGVDLARGAGSYATTAVDMWMPAVQHGMGATAPVTAAGTASTLRAWPWVITRTTSTDSMRFEVSTGQAGSHVSLGVYADTNSNGYPDKLLKDLGSYTTTSNAVRTDTVSISLTLPPGLYFVGMNCDGATPATLRCVDVSQIPSVLGMYVAMGGSANVCGWTKGSETYSYPYAMPNPFPAGASILVNTRAPLLIFKTTFP